MIDMSNKINDVFISYCRSGGFETANHLHKLLVDDGYTVSFDIKSLQEGPFNQALLSLIEQCSDFILVVDKSAFARMTAPDADPKDDWLRQELSYALQLKKNIIPVLLPGSEFPTFLPDDVNEVRYKNGPMYSRDYFDMFYSKLKSFLHSVPRNYAMITTDGRVPTLSLSYLKVKADLDCIFYLDGEEKAQLKAGKLQKIPLKHGEYELKFVSSENAADRLKMEFEMPDGDKIQNVSLCPIRDKRLQKEAEVQRIAKEETRRLAEDRTKTEKIRKVEEEIRILAEERGKTEKELRADEEVGIFTVNGVSFKMIRVEGDTFKMGSKWDSEAANDEKPVHEVTLSDYSIGETLVTQILWQAVMGSNPSGFIGANRPVENVSWKDCHEFISQLNILTGKHFRLPTEAEWEFAARGGKKGNCFKYSGSDDLCEVAWFRDNSNGETQEVKTKSANELGLYDMSGNVWEWCNDWYGRYPSSTQTNPQGSSTGSSRVCRGGSWGRSASCCRTTYRYFDTPTNRHYYLGLRLAL